MVSKSVILFFVCRIHLCVRIGKRVQGFTLLLSLFNKCNSVFIILVIHLFGCYSPVSILVSNSLVKTKLYGVGVNSLGV